MKKEQDLQTLICSGKYEKLKVEADRLLKINESNYDAMNALAVAYKNLGNTKRLEKYF